MGSIQPDPVNVIVVGAGFGGLTAAIEMRRKGANVTVFESTKRLTEQGQSPVACSWHATLAADVTEAESIADQINLLRRYRPDCLKRNQSTGEMGRRSPENRRRFSSTALPGLPGLSGQITESARYALRLRRLPQYLPQPGKSPSDLL